MNAQLMAKTAYSGATNSTRTGRGTEYEIFAQVTRRLKTAMQGDGDFNTLVRALHDNRALWTALAADVATETNELPADLRARIFHLAQFTAHQTGRILAGVAGAEVLIDINTAVMRGLRSTGEAA